MNTTLQAVKSHPWQAGGGVFAFIIILILTMLTTSMAWGKPFSSLQRYQHGAKTTHEIYGENGELVKRYTDIDPSGPEGHHTLEFAIGGAKMQGIKMTSVHMKPGSAGTVRFQIAANLGFSIMTGDFDLTNSRFAKLEVKNSECRQIDVRGVQADGATTPITAASPMLPNRSFSSFEALPVWTVDATKYDVIMITAASNAEVGFIKIDDAGVPGDAVVERVKANKCNFKDSTIGRGDGSSTKELIFDNVKSNGAAIGNVDESASIDNTR